MGMFFEGEKFKARYPTLLLTMKAISGPNTWRAPRLCSHSADFVRPFGPGGWRRWEQARPAAIWWSPAVRATHRAGGGRRWALLLLRAARPCPRKSGAVPRNLPRRPVAARRGTGRTPLWARRRARWSRARWR